MMSNKQKQGIALGLLALIIIVIVGVFIRGSQKGIHKVNPVVNNKEQTMQEPVFRNDGDLTFLAGTKKLKTISMEIAKDEAARNQGLMFRKTMPDSCGMLFVFENMQPLSFWMKNTIMPLDIIFIDDHFKIITIAKNTVPFSEQSIPAASDGMYVVEVNAGFTDKYHVAEGNTITFTTR
ncbi:MAG: DUF192 domain-containing protein [Bacteroidota bacterium]